MVFDDQPPAVDLLVNVGEPGPDRGLTAVLPGQAEPVVPTVYGVLVVENPDMRLPCGFLGRESSSKYSLIWSRFDRTTGLSVGRSTPSAA